MFHNLRRKTTTIFLLAMLATSALWASPSKGHNLTDAQLNAFLGIITNFILSDEPTHTHTHKARVLKKTGQTRSYNEYGDEVTDNSIKDDGFYQKGTTPSYTRDDATDIVTDHITGLQWADDANVGNSDMRKQWLTTTNNDICAGQNGQTQDIAKCTDTTGDTAATYCSNLTLGGHSDWRLPTIDELMYIADRSKRDPAIDTTVFQNVISGYYWSSSTLVDFEDLAWYVTFYEGNGMWSYKFPTNYVLCVRDGQP